MTFEAGARLFLLPWVNETVKIAKWPFPEHASLFHAAEDPTQNEC